MEFGRVPKNRLNKIDFTLPADPLMNKQVLKGAGKIKGRVYYGTGKWGRKEYIGKIYPKGTREAAFLDEYFRHFNSVELNATHYKMYKAADIKKWTGSATKDFRFAPKMYKGVSHFGNMGNKQELTRDFLNGISAFGKNLGPVFIQLGDRFGLKRKDELFSFLQTLPKEFTFFLELRHPDWFIQPNRDELFLLLKKLKIGAVITDTAGRRDCCHMQLTIPKTLIRFEGHNLHPTDYTRVDQWVNRIGSWLKQGIKEVYFFMHMENEAWSPELCFYFTQQLKKQYGPGLTSPQLLYKPRNSK